MTKCFLSLFAAVLTAGSALALDWMTDLDAACKKAQEENKLVLLEFTGSDWCGYCIRLKKNILETPEFETYAKEKFVPVEVDLPRNTAKLSAETLAQNNQLVRKHAVSAFPTLMVMHPTGRVVGGFKGAKPGFAEVQSALDSAWENGAVAGRLDALQGEERLKALYSLYAACRRGQLTAEQVEYGALLEAEDRDGVTPIVDEVRSRTVLAELWAAVEGKEKKEELLPLLGTALAELKDPYARADVLMFRARLLVKEAETMEEVDAAQADLLQVEKENPERHYEVEHLNKLIFQDKEDVLVQNERLRRQQQREREKKAKQQA